MQHLCGCGWNCYGPARCAPRCNHIIISARSPPTPWSSASPLHIEEPLYLHASHTLANPPSPFRAFLLEHSTRVSMSSSLPVMCSARRNSASSQGSGEPNHHEATSWVATHRPYVGIHALSSLHPPSSLNAGTFCTFSRSPPSFRSPVCPAPVFFYSPGNVPARLEQRNNPQQFPETDTTILRNRHNISEKADKPHPSYKVATRGREASPERNFQRDEEGFAP